MAQSEVLREAAEQGDSAGVAFAIRHGADVNAADLQSGMCALHYAAWHGRNAVIDQLLSAGSHPDQKASSGLTALLMAAW